MHFGAADINESRFGVGLISHFSSSCGYHPDSCSCFDPAANKAVKLGSLYVFYCQLSFDGMQNNLTALGQWSAQSLFFPRKSVIHNKGTRVEVYVIDLCDVG